MHRETAGVFCDSITMATHGNMKLAGRAWRFTSRRELLLAICLPRQGALQLQGHSPTTLENTKTCHSRIKKTKKQKQEALLRMTLLLSQPQALALCSSTLNSTNQFDLDPSQKQLSQ